MAASRVVVKFTWRSLGALHEALVAHVERLNSFLEPSWPDVENGGFLVGSWGRPEMF
jgi:hypothetical protein